MSITSLIQRSLISFAVLTVLGVLVHDTKFDHAATIALAIPIGLTISLAHAPELRSEGHTHVERAIFEKTISMLNGTPKVQPRTDHRSYRLTKHIGGFNAPEEHTLILSPALA